MCVQVYIGVSMKALSVFTASLALFITASANAYILTEKFVTEHYGVYEAILGKTEIYNDNLEQIIIKDMADRKKFQTTTIVFSNTSNGLSSTIKEPAVSVITTEPVDGSTPSIPGVISSFLILVMKKSYADIVPDTRRA